MVFGADKKLVPSVEASSPELMGSGKFQGINSYGNMINAAGQASSDGGATSMAGGQSA